MTEDKLAPIRPGEILRAEFLTPLGISQARLARDISLVQPSIGILAPTRCALSQIIAHSM